MDKELIKTIISEGWEYIGGIELVHRNIAFEASGSYVVVGPRQAGKSYLLYQRMHDFLADGESIERLVYVNFDDERLIGMSHEDLDLILQAYYAMREEAPVFFFDEIQNVDGWEHFARRLANRKYQVFITGSNAKMLSRDIETVLGGRYMVINLYPYSFAEYLKAEGVTLGRNWQYGRSRDAVVLRFATYFRWGGFPELVRFREKRSWLNSLYNRIFFNDMVVRYKIKNNEALRLMVRRVADSVKQPLSYNRLANLVKSTGVSCSPSTVIDYLRYLQEGFLLFSVSNYASKFVERETVKKNYFVDNGLLSLFLADPDTSLLENLCAVHLHKLYGDGLYFYNKNIEVDFFVPDVGLAVQAAFRLADRETLEREKNALKRLDAIHPLRQALIITYDEEATIDEDGLMIAVRPAWKWLLE